MWLPTSQAVKWPLRPISGPWSCDVLQDPRGCLRSVRRPQREGSFPLGLGKGSWGVVCACSSPWKSCGPSLTSAPPPPGRAL